MFDCQGCPDVENRSGLFTIRPDGSALRLVLPDQSCEGSPGCARFWAPAWSPDGRQIAFERKSTRAEIWRSAADGSRPRRVTLGSLDDEDPDWSPDGRRLVFTREVRARDGTYSFLWVVRADGTHARRLLRMPEVSEPSWSPDGSKIAFTDKNGRLFAVRPDGTRLQRLGGRKLLGVMPRWSPEGRRLALSRVRDHEAVGIAVLEPTGRVRVTPVPRRPVFAHSWSPDGKWIAAATFRRIECDEDYCPRFLDLWVVRLRDGYRKLILSVREGEARGLDWRNERTGGAGPPVLRTGLSE